MKKVLYWGAGGHGMQALLYFILMHPEYQHTILTNVIDSGGHTGRIAKLFNNKTIPVGDIRNQLTNYWELFERVYPGQSNARTLESYFEASTKSIDELRVLMNSFTTYIDRPPLTAILNKFTNLYIDRFRRSKFDINSEHKIGNLILTACGMHFLKNEEFKPFEKGVQYILEIIKFPSNINFTFFYPERLHFEAKDGNLIFAKDEEAFDDSEIAIPQDTFNLFRISTTNPGSITSKDIDPEIVKLINEASIIIIPPGTEVNSGDWNRKIYKDILIKADKPIIKIVNLMRLPNSRGIAEEMVYNFKNGLKVFYLLSKNVDEVNAEIFKDLSAEASMRLVNSYRKQGKTNQFYDENELKNKIIEELLSREHNYNDPLEVTADADKIMMDVFPGLEVKRFDGNGEESSESILEKGFRHDPEQINALLSRLTELDGELTRENVWCALDQFRNAYNEAYEVKLGIH